MSVSTAYTNANQGPIKLQHDITPRDFADLAPSSQTQTGLPPGANQFGFQGFAQNNFEKGTLRGSQDQNEAKQSPRGVPHYMGNPRHHGEGLGLVYGSEGATDQPTTRRSLASKTEPVDKSAELRRFHQQQGEAAADIATYKRERQTRLEQRDAEKRQDLEQLKAYNPWGKPGAGAPKKGEDHKKAGLTDRDLFQKDHQSPRRDELRSEYGDFHTYFSRPGHGAPLRTDSGTVRTQLKGDALLRFQDSQGGRQVMDTEVRYQAPSHVKQRYHQDLEKQVEKKSVTAHEQRLTELRQDLEMLQKYQPFGKPGAGAPNKTRSEQVRGPPNRANSDADVYDPWGKGAGHPVRNPQGDVQRYKYSDSRVREPHTDNVHSTQVMEEGVSLPVGASRGGGGGAPLTTDSGKVKVKLPITMRRNEKGDTTIRDASSRHRPPQSDPELAVYDPFGRSGNGAPLRDGQGNVRTNVYGQLPDTKQQRSSADPKERQKANQEYLNMLQYGQKSVTQEKEIDGRKIANKSREKSAEQDLAAIMKRGQVGRPRRDPMTGLLTDQHLGTSDVTKEQTDERRQVTDQSSDYHTELQRAATEREHVRQLDRLRSNHEGQKHQSSMNEFWGRPGAGAPQTQTKKINLENSLFAPRKEDEVPSWENQKNLDNFSRPNKPAQQQSPPTRHSTNDFYNKNPAGHKPYNFIRNTVNSVHRNQYEFPVLPRRQPKKDYNLLTPYATVASDDI